MLTNVKRERGTLEFSGDHSVEAYERARALDLLRAPVQTLSFC